MSTNPYEPVGPSSSYLAPATEGSFGLGVALGVLLGLWGLIGCWLLGKAETKRGAAYGFFGRLGLTIVIGGLAILLSD